MKKDLMFFITVIIIVLIVLGIAALIPNPSTFIEHNNFTIVTTVTTTTTTIPMITTTTQIEKYPIARKVWDIMKSYGWNDYICAGILGNMMRECGGDTLNLKWNIWNRSRTHYGLCQWSKRYHPEVLGRNIEEQMKYLKNTLDINMFNTCGSPEEAAYIFSKNYERPAQVDPNYHRRENARIAYYYFT